jgi:acetyl/propionyl-CoA carboxylase alpha subunit
MSGRSSGIRKLLVANRGEIAARIFETCRRLGLDTVAVYAPDDTGAFHTRRADDAVAIGSYLDPAELIRAAQDSGADAIHPGYGFLAESADFAEAVLRAGLVFVGPSPAAIRAAGDKVEAKRLARESGVPVVESGEPEDLGYPLMVKAAAGGGGRGMRIVRAPEDLETAFESATREAQAGFGDGRVFAERYVDRPRHVEIQILADRQGEVVHLGERECSIQRRHQKVLEESPSPALDPELRAAMGSAAIAFARIVGYENAGTAEFMLAGQDFFFLELNARLQVEHPVTELVTGLDLVEQQLRLATGEPLGIEAREPEGHAVEVRLYAEHPLTFLPQAGRLELLELPETIRVDAGVEAGDEVPVAYDPLLAKLIAHGETREEAFDDLSRALRATRVAGVTTNLGFLRWLVDHPAVRAGDTTTAFLSDHPPLSVPIPARGPWTRYWRANRDRASAPPSPTVAPMVEGSAHLADGGHETSAVVAPMPGVVVRVLAGEGDRVESRQPLVVLEAMKMETPIVSPYAAVVKRVHVAEGDRVPGGMLLVELED